MESERQELQSSQVSGWAAGRMVVLHWKNNRTKCRGFWGRGVEEAGNIKYEFTCLDIFGRELDRSICVKKEVWADSRFGRHQESSNYGEEPPRLLH